MKLWRMARRAALASVVALAAVFGGAAAADPAAETRDVIERQLEAFSRDAWAEAFTFAAPGIQDLFGTPERFGQMVRQGYPMVWRPADVEFLDLAPREDGGVVQRLRIVDEAGVEHYLLYGLAKTGDAWRIDFVTKIKAPDISV